MDQTYQSNEDRLVAMRQFWAQTDDDWNTGALEKQANDSSQQIVNDILSTSSKIWPFSKDPIKKTIRLNKREVKLFIKKAKETVLRLKEAGAGEEHLDSIIQLITAYENEYENGNFDWSANDALQRFKDKVADENMRDEILLDVYYLNANFPSERMALDDLSNDADRPVYIPSIEINRLEHEEPVNDIRTHIKIEPTSEEIKKNTNDERKQLLKESGTLGGLTKKLVEKTGDDAYSLKNLQTNFFEKGTDFSGNLDLYGNVYGLWPNLILLYYLTQEAWTPAEGYPVVKSYVAPGGQLVILSTFKGSIQMQKDEKKQGDKNPGSAANNNAVITAYNHIAVKGLKDQAANGFYLYSNEEDYENVISLSDPDLGFKLRDDVKDGIALSRGYKLKESQYQQEYNILRENGYTKSISEYRANPISLRDFLEGGKIFENVNIPAIVNNGEGVNIRKNPFSPDDIERLGKNYEGPNPNFIKLIPFNTHLTVKRKTTQVGEDWAYIETENGDKGYASLVYIETEMPEPKARYHKVKEGETISLVAIKSHGSIDLTDYITALEIINPSIKDKLLTPGHLLWIPTQEYALKLIMALPRNQRNTVTTEEAANELAKKLCEAFKTRDEKEVIKLLKGVSHETIVATSKVFDEKYSADRFGRNFYADLYHAVDLGREDLWEVFAMVTPKTQNSNSVEGKELTIGGLTGAIAPVGATFTASISSIGFQYVSEYYREASCEVLWMIPGNTFPQAHYYVSSVEIDEAVEGTYDFIFIVKKSEKEMYPLRIQQVVTNVTVLSDALMDKLEHKSYPTFRAELEMQKISMSGGVVADQNPGKLPYIKISGGDARNPISQNEDPVETFNGYTVVPSPEGVTYKWYGFQMRRGINYATSTWNPTSADPGQNKKFGSNTYVYLGEGLSKAISMNMRGNLHILVEEYDKEGKPTGKYAQYIQHVFEDISTDWDYTSAIPDPNSGEEKLRKMKDAIGQVEEDINKIKGTPVPIKTGYINTETGNEMAVPLYIGESADRGKGNYIIVDLMPGVAEREFYGKTVDEALAMFKDWNQYPPGWISLEIQTNDQGIPAYKEEYATDGIAGWERWTTTTGWLSLGMGLLGVALEFVPGAQALGGWLIVGSMTLGAASAGFSIYDKMHDAVPGADVGIDVLNLVGSFMSAGGKALSLMLKTNVGPLANLGKFMYFGGAVTDVGTGVFMGIDGMNQIISILERKDLSDSEKAVLLARAITSMMLGGYLMANFGKAFKPELLDPAMHIKYGVYVDDVKKIDLMGGPTSKLGDDFVNIDIAATKGIKGSSTDMSKFIEPNSVDEIVVSNPFNPTIKNPYELFLNESYTVLKPGGTIRINGQNQNPLFKKITVKECEAMGFEVVEFKGALPKDFKELDYFTTHGDKINPETMQSILLKKK